MGLSPNSNASRWSSSKTIPNCVLAEIQIHLTEWSLRQFQMVSHPKIICFSSKLFQENSNCVLAKIQLHLIEINLGQFQIVSQPKFSCNSSKFFQENSKLCIGRKTVASHWSYSKTFPIGFLAKIQLHLIGFI